MQESFQKGNHCTTKCFSNSFLKAYALYCDEAPISVYRVNTHNFFTFLKSSS